jgi:hypothetical protein
MPSFPECDQFQDHRRAICRGERPDLSCEIINQYRTIWGMGPLPTDVTLTADDVPREPTQASGAMPSLVQRAATFAAAFQEHLRDGMAKNEPTEIQARLEVCQQCPSFTGSHCRECGCACNSTSTFLNKLAWRSERCPVGRW